MSANADPNRVATVLLVDVAGSSSLPDFRAGRDRRLRALSQRHLAAGWIAADYAVTAWDEFQTVKIGRAHV